MFVEKLTKEMYLRMRRVRPLSPTPRYTGHNTLTTLQMSS